MFSTSGSMSLFWSNITAVSCYRKLLAVRFFFLCLVDLIPGDNHTGNYSFRQIFHSLSFDAEPTATYLENCNSSESGALLRACKWKQHLWNHWTKNSLRITLSSRPAPVFCHYPREIPVCLFALGNNKLLSEAMGVPASVCCSTVCKCTHTLPQCSSLPPGFCLFIFCLFFCFIYW